MEASLRVKTLYRLCIRCLPDVIKLYGLTDMDLYQMRRKVSEKFRANENVTDLKLIDHLIHKGEQVFLFIFWKFQVSFCEKRWKCGFRRFICFTSLRIQNQLRIQEKSLQIRSFSMIFIKVEILHRRFKASHYQDYKFVY